MTNADSSLPPALHAYLSAPSLAPVWSAARTRLERNGLQATGTVTVDVDHSTAEYLSGLVGSAITPGAARRISLAALDAALRRSSGGRGLVSVPEIMDGRPVANEAAPAGVTSPRKRPRSA